LPTNVFDVSELAGTEIHSGFIGSCTNGRLADLQEAARVLEGKKVKDGIMLKIVPATQKVYAELLREGVLETLFASGAIISNPGCGGCAEGHIGLTGQGEVQISTGNRNFAGKQGKGLTYLASPAVVAASCVRGEICNPEDL
jgi:3-isopropylmalate/(R)-2-methylmalate dehydratase large subunit